MNKHNTIWAVVAAAGIGARMQSDTPKQYLQLLNRRVIDHALLALCRHAAIAGVIVGVRDQDAHWRAQPFRHDKLIAVARGGPRRAHTVLNAVRQLLRARIARDDDWVMVHDAARPCLLAADIDRLIAAGNARGGAVLARRVVDALKQSRARDNKNPAIANHLDDNNYWCALTPQLFRCRQLEKALSESLARGETPRDESAAMAAHGVRAALVEGHPGNIKITEPRDLELASVYLRMIHSASPADNIAGE